MHDLPRVGKGKIMVSGPLLWKKLKARQEALMRDLQDDEGLIAEYVSPAGRVILIREVGYYSDTDALILLVGDDEDTKDECQIIAQPHAVEIVYKVVKKELRKQPIKPIRFVVERPPEEEEQTSE
jgi:hypothetical protein